MRRPRFGSRSLAYFAIGLVLGVVAAFVLRTIHHATNLPEARRLFPDTAPQYLEETGNPLDFAINGPGFFAFEDKDGNWVFSRESRFVINEDGELSSQHGHKLVSRGRAPQNNPNPKPPVQFEPESILVDALNLAWMIEPASKTGTPIQSITLYRFPSHKNYVWGGDNFWFGRPSGETPLVVPLNLNRIEPKILSGYRLRPDPPPGELNPFNVNGPYHNGPKNIESEPLINTENDLDFGIDGDGFVAVDLSINPTNLQNNNSMRYIGFTRWLSFNTDENGLLVRKYPGRLISDRSNSPRALARPPGAGSMVLIEYVPLLRRISIDSTYRSNQTSIMKPHDGFVAPSIGIPIFDEDLFNAHLGEEPFYFGAEYKNVKLENMKDVELYRFANPQNLHYICNGVYNANDLSGPPVAVPQDEARLMLKQGYLNEVERLKP